MRHRYALAVAVGVAVGLLLPAAASASTKTSRDARDTPGSRLDIKSISHGHAARDPSRIIHTITMHRGWTKRALQGRNAIVLTIDTNANWGNGAEAYVVIWAGRRFRAAVLNKRGEIAYLLRRPVRVGSRTVQVELDADDFNPQGYLWFASTIDGSRVDHAPNRRSLLHDLRDPQVKITGPSIPTTLQAKLTVTVSDKGYSGIGSWWLERRGLGETTWAVVASGTKAGKRTVTVKGAQGDSFEYRAVARDGNGNRAIAKKAVSFPLDDRDPAITFAGTWQQVASSSSFLGTLTQATPSALRQLSFVFVGNSVALVGPGLCGEATAEIDGWPYAFYMPCDAAKRRVVFRATDAFGPNEHLFTLTVPQGTSFALDGVIARLPEP